MPNEITQAGNLRAKRGRFANFGERLIPFSIRGDIFLGVLAAIFCSIGSWTVSTWMDESATAHIISYSRDQMNDLFKTTDLVYAPYYYILHYWVKFVGINPFTLRLLSILAAGIGTGAMAAAGRISTGRRGQLLYAVCFALLPRTLSVAIEARPYSLAAMFTALSLLMVILLIRRASRVRAALLALFMCLAILMQLYSALAIAGLVMVALVISKGRARLLTLAASVIAVLAILPLAMASMAQVGQVGWIDSLTPRRLDTLLVESWATSRTQYDLLPGDVLPHYIAVGMAVVAGLLVLSAFLNASRGEILHLISLMVPILVTSAVLLAYSVGVKNILVPRYLSSTAPFFAALFAECILLVRFRILKVLPVLLLIGSLALFCFQRLPYAKSDSEDYSLAANVIRSESEPGDGLLIEPNPVAFYDSYLASLSVDPEAFNNVTNIAEFTEGDWLRNIRVDPAALNLDDQEELPTRIWLGFQTQKPSGYAQQLMGLGYEMQWSQAGSPRGGHTMALWVRVS